MKCSKKTEFIKARWRGPTFKLWRGSWGPTFKTEGGGGSRVPFSNFEGGPRSQGPGPTSTPCPTSTPISSDSYEEIFKPNKGHRNDCLYTVLFVRRPC